MKSAHDLGAARRRRRAPLGRGLHDAAHRTGRRARRRVARARADFLEDTGVRVTRPRRRPRGRVPRVARRAATRSRRSTCSSPPMPRDRWITRRLYEPRPDCRLAQEMLLGIGGVRALRRSASPRRASTTSTRATRVFAGHRADRRRAWRRARASRRRGARRASRIVFTTHTPVPAGNEVHALGELRRARRGLRAGRRRAARARRRPVQHDGGGAAAVARRPTPSPSCTARPRARCGRDVDGARRSSRSPTACTSPTWQDARVRARRVASDAALLAARAASSRASCWPRSSGAPACSSTPTGSIIGVRAARGDLQARRPGPPRPERASRRLLEDRRMQLVFAGKAHPPTARARRWCAQLVEASRQ